MKKLEDYVVSIPDFPQEGIIFRDVTSVLENADGLHLAIDGLEEKIGDREFDVIVGPESRSRTTITRHLCRCERRENFHVRRYLLPMSWSTAPRKSRFTSAPSSREIK